MSNDLYLFNSLVLCHILAQNSCHGLTPIWYPFITLSSVPFITTQSDIMLHDLILLLCNNWCSTHSYVVTTRVTTQQIFLWMYHIDTGMVMQTVHWILYWIVAQHGGDLLLILTSKAQVRSFVYNVLHDHVNLLVIHLYFGEMCMLR